MFGEKRLSFFAITYRAIPPLAIESNLNCLATLLKKLKEKENYYIKLMCRIQRET